MYGFGEYAMLYKSNVCHVSIIEKKKTLNFNAIMQSPEYWRTTVYNQGRREQNLPWVKLFINDLFYLYLKYKLSYLICHHMSIEIF